MRRRQSNRKRGSVSTEARCMLLALKVNRGHESRNARNTALESGNIKETGSPPQPPGVWACQHLDFGW